MHIAKFLKRGELMANKRLWQFLEDLRPERGKKLRTCLALARLQVPHFVSLRILS